MFPWLSRLIGSLVGLCRRSFLSGVFWLRLMPWFCVIACAAPVFCVAPQAFDWPPACFGCGCFSSWRAVDPCVLHSAFPPKFPLRLFLLFAKQHAQGYIRLPFPFDFPHNMLNFAFTCAGLYLITQLDTVRQYLSETRAPTDDLTTRVDRLILDSADCNNFFVNRRKVELRLRFPEKERDQRAVDHTLKIYKTPCHRWELLCSDRYGHLLASHYYSNGKTPRIHLTETFAPQEH